MIRSFLALPVPDALVHQLTLVQAKLPLPRRIPSENFHVTLVFLDKQPETVLEDLHYTLVDTRLPAPTLMFEGLGTFGGDEPDAVHMRIAPDPDLQRLQSKVSHCARDAGIATKSRKFIPHVTLGRLRLGEVSAERLAQAFATIGTVKSDPWRPETLNLYRSTLRPDGPVYDVMAEYPLSL